MKAVTLTGSERAGAEVASAAARQIKKSVLELGGSDPFIVMPSADFDCALETAVKARMINTGQSCIAAKRFIIAEDFYSDFVPRFADAHGVAESRRSARSGDRSRPARERADPARRRRAGESIGRRRREAAHRREANRSPGLLLRADGAGRRAAGFVRQRSEEIFGPVAAFFRVRDAEEAIAVANDSPFGLGASVWTNDPNEQALFAAQLEVGMVFFNSMVASDPRLPFGGVKRSGYGRELGAEGIREFVNVKTVVVA